MHVILPRRAEDPPLYRRAGLAVAFAVHLGRETQELIDRVRMTAADARACRQESSRTIALSRAMRRLRRSSIR